MPHFPPLRLCWTPKPPQYRALSFSFWKYDVSEDNTFYLTLSHGWGKLLCRSEGLWLLSIPPPLNIAGWLIALLNNFNYTWRCIMLFVWRLSQTLYSVMCNVSVGWHMFYVLDCWRSEVEMMNIALRVFRVPLLVKPQLVDCVSVSLLSDLWNRSGQTQSPYRNWYSRTDLRCWEAHPPHWAPPRRLQHPAILSDGITGKLHWKLGITNRLETRATLNYFRVQLPCSFFLAWPRNKM